ncbi:kinase-like protein [Suillus decipiens]|nr:kinase-like protein [Suillus decipiens]
MYACHLILSPDSCQLVYTTLVDTNIYLCNIPSEFLTSIQRLQQVRASAPRNPPLVDSGAFFLTTNKFTSDTSPNAQQSLPSHSLVLPSVSFARRRAGFESGTSRIQPTDTDSSPDKRWGKYFEPGFHPLHDSSFSYTHTVFFTGNDERDDLPPKATLQDLSEFITKDGDYPVARGGFGEIWKCTFDIGRGSVKVAVKALQVYADDQFGAAKTKKINRMKRELMICANLNHANILPVHGYTTGFGPFIAIVSPWAESGNLTTYLKREHADLILLRRFEILRDVIAGLQYLHANNVIHGDFSGPNVLIHGDGTACISDFGLSLMYSEVISASQASWTSTLKGNMRWMAPERLVLEREDGSPTRPSEQSDIFSFGGVMLQVLTNEIPYYYLANDAAIVLCIARSETPSRARYSELSEKYWQFIEQCWSTDPRDRPSTDEANETIRNEFYSLSGSR